VDPRPVVDVVLLDLTIPALAASQFETLQGSLTSCAAGHAGSRSTP
jgi:hypothetical protein